MIYSIWKLYKKNLCISLPHWIVFFRWNTRNEHICWSFLYGWGWRKFLPWLNEIYLCVEKCLQNLYMYINYNKRVFLKIRRIKYKNKFTSAVGINLESSSSEGAGAQSACGIWQTLFCDWSEVCRLFGLSSLKLLPRSQYPISKFTLKV